MPGGITLKSVDPADIPTPDTDKSTIFVDSTNADTPSYKDDTGAVLPLGTTGATGATGPAGPAGPQAIGFVLYDTVSAEEPMMMPGGGGSGSGTPFTGNPWELITTQVVAGAANYDFPNLGDYTDIMVVLALVTAGASVSRLVRVSTNNGASFLNTSGDYRTVSGTGTESNATSLAAVGTASNAARSGVVQIFGFNTPGAPRVAFVTGATFSLIMDTNAYNAVQVIVSGTTMDAGNIYIYGRI